MRPSESPQDPARAECFFGSLDPNRITLTYGRDITLNPPQQAEPLNYLVFPHAEADGQAVPMTKRNWTFSWKDRR